MLNFLLDLVELYIPLLAFCILFASFIWAIFARYVLNSPCRWATDVELGCYIWVILFSASYVMRLDSHVRFTIVYDLVGETPKLFIRLVSNLLIIIPFCCLVIPTYRYLLNLKTISTALQIPLKIYYAPILWFLISVILYAVRDFCKDLHILTHPDIQMDSCNNNDKKEDKS